MTHKMNVIIGSQNVFLSCYVIFVLENQTGLVTFSYSADRHGINEFCFAIASPNYTIVFFETLRFLLYGNQELLSRAVIGPG